VPTQDVIVYYNLLSPWITLHWVGGLPIMPYHIWYWVPWWDYDGDGSIDTWLFDPEIEDALYGSGPYIFDHRTPGIEILLKSFEVGQVYKGITSTGSYFEYAHLGDLGNDAPAFRKFDGDTDGYDLALWIQCFNGLAPPQHIMLGDLGNDAPAFYKFDGDTDGYDLALWIQCFNGLGPN